MKKRSEPSDRDHLRERLIGLGERSYRKSYFPELQNRLDELERFRALLDQVEDMIFVLDEPRRVILDVNASACRHLQRDREDLLGHQIGEFVVESLDDFPLETPHVSAGARFALLRRGEDLPLPVELSISTAHLREEPYTVFVARDITERKRAEEALRESDRMKSEFISTVAHELNTPLTSIRGFSELLLSADRLTPEERNEFLTYVHEKSVALSEIVSEVLDIARIESGQGISLKKIACPVVELQRLLDPLMEADRGRHRFEVDLREPQLSLFIDKGKIGQVLENLLSNAMKYSAEGTPVRIGGQAVSGEYRVTVEDEGIGMTPEETSRIFDKFYRAEDSATEVGGIGLGMSIAQGIVEAHGGGIWVKSRKGQGTTVEFSLPLEG